MASSKRAEFLGIVTDVRFVQLPDGRKIMQVWQPVESGWQWRTPETVPFADLPADEQRALAIAVPPMHRDNGDGV